MDQNIPNRRKFLKLASVATGTVVAPTSIVSAKNNKKEINLDFNPSSKKQVAEFTRELKDVDDLEQVWNSITPEQQAAVRDMAMPQDIETGAVRSQTESESDSFGITTQSSWEEETVIGNAAAEGGYPYDQLWVFSLEAS